MNNLDAAPTHVLLLPPTTDQQRNARITLAESALSVQAGPGELAVVLRMVGLR